ncbi:MAG: nucleoside 2-deoxyribosyltransferase [Candidatus Pacebacteria bacterium]|nr:nucleoside 2-deoxyribosyltransferase [Candidatus Paceibacterota bacterium]
MKPVAYVASPLGFSEAGKLFYDTVLIPLIAEIGFEIRDPWTLTPREFIDPVQALPYGEEKRKRWTGLNLVIGSNNRKAIEESDIIVAVLDGTDVDSGTAAEIGYGSALGKTIVGYRGDFRPGGENEGSIVNLQVEYFIYLNNGEIVTDLESLKIALAKYENRFSRKLED